MEKSKISSKTWQMENCKSALKKKLRAKHLAKHAKNGQKTANRKITKKIRKVVSRTRQGFGELIQFIKNDKNLLLQIPKLKITVFQNLYEMTLNL